MTEILLRRMKFASMALRMIAALAGIFAVVSTLWWLTEIGDMDGSVWLKLSVFWASASTFWLLPVVAWIGSVIADALVLRWIEGDDPEAFEGSAAPQAAPTGLTDA